VTPHIQELGDLIHRLHGGTATHLESVPITERFNGKTIWDGIVEVFRLKGHAKTDRVYAWMHHTDDPARPKRHVTVLHIPPVVSPRSAVQAAIVQEFKDRASVN
jgi:hypothetical protein